MIVQTTTLEGLLLIQPQVFRDERGWFLEPWNKERFAQHGILTDFSQDNHSCSGKNILRGLHFQRTPGQAKLVRCTRGRIWDVAVDIRVNSPTFGRWHAVELDGESMNSFYIPVGFAHGFCVLSETAEVQYKCSTNYNPQTEDGITWDDPDLAINWPVQKPILSSRDLSNQSFALYREKISTAKL